MGVATTLCEQYRDLAPETGSDVMSIPPPWKEVRQRPSKRTVSARKRERRSKSTPSVKKRKGLLDNITTMEIHHQQFQPTLDRQLGGVNTLHRIGKKTI